MITNFINSIEKIEEYDFANAKTKYQWYIFGDGGGDMESHSDDTTIECLENYIKFCEKQILRAREFLLIKENQK